MSQLWSCNLEPTKRCFIWPSTQIAHVFLSLSAGIRVLVDAREKLHIPWGNPSNQRHGNTMMAFDTRSAMAHGHGMVEPKVFQHYLPSIKALWADQGIQNAYDRRMEFQLVSEPAQVQSAVMWHLKNLNWYSHQTLRWNHYLTLSCRNSDNLSLDFIL